MHTGLSYAGPFNYNIVNIHIHNNQINRYNINFIYHNRSEFEQVAGLEQHINMCDKLLIPHCIDYILLP